MTRNIDAARPTPPARRAGRWATAAALLALAACGQTLSRSPVPAELAHAAEPFGRPGLRFWGDALSRAEVDAFLAVHAPAMRAAFGAEIAAGRTPKVDYLALSGGGQWGAFGAGVLAAWTEAGTRPEFQGVSGVSTGAIIAPFAFLGPDHDATLREIYSLYATADLVEPTVLSGLLSGTALSDTARLGEVIARYITPEVLAAIAAEHRRGRLLHIGTTNLDAGRPVIWDVGAIAASGEPGALELVRQLIRASAAIPVAFPPIIVPVQTPDGRTFDEMHVDGGASSQVTFVSPAIPIAEATREVLGRDIDRRIWVIVNNDLEPPHRTLPARLPAIGEAAVSSLIRGSGVGGIGVSRIEARGEVYGLKRPEDIEGAYAQVRYGAVAGDDSMGELWLQNASGVEIRLESTRKGLALSLGGDAVYIRLD